MKEGIPKEVIEELKLKPKKETKEIGRIIVEKHQVSIKVPAKIRAELNLKEGSVKCEVILKNKKTLIIKVIQ